MSFELELKKRQEEFARAQEELIREISLIRAESRFNINAHSLFIYN